MAHLSLYEHHDTSQQPVFIYETNATKGSWSSTGVSSSWLYVRRRMCTARNVRGYCYPDLHLIQNTISQRDGLQQQDKWQSFDQPVWFLQGLDNIWIKYVLVIIAACELWRWRGHIIQLSDCIHSFSSPHLSTAGATFIPGREPQSN